MKKHNLVTTVVTYLVLALAGVVSFVLPDELAVSTAKAAPAAKGTVTLTGVIRDFRETHSDFKITDLTEMGHYVHNVANSLGADGRPMYTGGGTHVVAQFKDKDNNPIMPIGDHDLGLPGGHFDVDVYDKPTDKGLWHKHEFDDAYDVTYVEIANDAKFLFRKTIPLTYPNNLRLEFFNVHNGGGGTYRFQAGGPLLTGFTSAGFTQVFDPKKLTLLRVNFTSLNLLRGTTPKTAQSDVANRDGALAIRMYDTVTNKLVYEVAVYNHGTAVPPPPPPPTLDACGNVVNDTIGLLGDSSTAAVTSLDSFNQWFHDNLGTNLSETHSINLTKNASGVYEYIDSEFFPIDHRLYGNEGQDHNYFFTYQLGSTFTYHKCTNQYFEFEGNDDCWVFIDGKLVLDLGGVRTGTRQYVALDRLGLVDGNTYPLDLFYASRGNSPISRFNVRTTIEFNQAPVASVSAGFD